MVALLLSRGSWRYDYDGGVSSRCSSTCSFLAARSGAFSTFGRFVVLQKDQKAANSRNIHIVVVVVGDVANALPYVALREQSPSYWAQTLEK